MYGCRGLQSLQAEIMIIFEVLTDGHTHTHTHTYSNSTYMKTSYIAIVIHTFVQKYIHLTYHLYPSSFQAAPSNNGHPPSFFRITFNGSSPAACGHTHCLRPQNIPLFTSIVSLSMQDWKTDLAIWKGLGSLALISPSRSPRTCTSSLSPRIENMEVRVLSSGITVSSMKLPQANW